MDDFPSNSRRPLNQQPSESQKTPPEAPKLEPVVVGKVIHRKKPLGRRLRELFFAGEGGVFVHIAKEVLIPALQNLAIDAVTQGLEKALGSPVRRVGSSYRSPQRPHISYDRPSTIVRSPVVNGPTSPMRRPAAPVRSSSTMEEIVVDSHSTAHIIIEKLYETIQDYGVASMANLREACGETPQYTDHRWGWNEEAEFGIRRVRDGYALVIPNPIEIR